MCGNCGTRVGAPRRAAPTDTSKYQRPVSGGVIAAPPGLAPTGAREVDPAPIDIAAAGHVEVVAPVQPPVVAEASDFSVDPLPVAELPDEVVEETIFAPRRAAGSRWTLTLASGGEVEFASRAVAGRAPRAPAGWEGAVLVSIDDPDRTVSKTHAGFAVDGDAVFVTDLDSTNGVAIVRPDGTESIVEPGRAVAIPEGADVELGSFAVRIARS